MIYVFCEEEGSDLQSQWHIRETSRKALCGAETVWDLKNYITEEALEARACKKCAEAYKLNTDFPG